MSLTPYMDLDKPVVEETEGPEWASMLNTLIDLLDAHDHSDAKGTPVTPAGFLVNDTIDFDNNPIDDISSVGFHSKNSADTTDLFSVQVVAGNLWYVNNAGAGVQITNGSSIVSSGSGVLSLNVVASYPYTVLTSDAQAVLGIQTAGGARALTLPAASTAMTVYIKDVEGSAQSNNITVTADGSDTIDGSATYVIDANYASVGLISDGVASWYVI